MGHKVVASFAAIWILLILGFVFVALWTDARTIKFNEKQFNEQQGLQVLLAKQGLSDQLTELGRDVEGAAQILSRGLWTGEDVDVDRIADVVFRRRGFVAATMVSDQRDWFPWLSGAYAPIVNLDERLDRYATALLSLDPGKVEWVSEIDISGGRQLVAVAYRVQSRSDDGTKRWLLAIIDLGQLLNIYVAPMRSGEYGAGYALDGDGNVIYDHEDEAIGRNVFDGMHDYYPQLLDLDKRMLVEQNGMAEYEFTFTRGGKDVRKLVAWDSLKFGEQTIVIALSAPESEINASLATHRRTILIAAAILIAGFIGSAVMILHLRHRMFEETAEELGHTVQMRTAELDRELKARVASEDRFRDFAESSSDWFWEMNEDLRFTLVSGRYKDITGWEPSFAIGKTRDEISADSVNTRRWNTHRSDLESRKPFRRFEYDLIGPDGRRLTLSISGVPIYDANGTFQGYRGTGSDITEQERNRAARDDALRDAENANRAKSEFLATMSHELRTPLNAILGFSDVLRLQMFGQHKSQKYEEYASDIHSSASHLLELVNDILDLSAIEAGRTELEVSDVSLREVIDDSLQTIHDAAYSKGIRINKTLPRDIPIVRGDRRALKQVLLNLLSNSTKFTPKDGEIDVGVHVSGETVQIVVKDTGTGIPAHRLEEIVEPFARGSLDPYKSEKGWGLGLAIANSLIQMHDGSLRIISDEGEGTTVSIRLPLK